MFVDDVTGDQGCFWMAVVLARVLWGLITDGLLWLVDAFGAQLMRMHVRCILSPSGLMREVGVRRFFRLTSVALFVGAIASWSAYAVIGSNVDTEGFLHEPFALVPLGWICVFGALVAGIAYVIARLRGI
ncbi:MAG: DUF3955 domain-containing protein [Coriobacteriia bacterium]|nr:DUF3955 domain-containing protein [Coriobacteriia bacterium]